MQVFCPYNKNLQRTEYLFMWINNDKFVQVDYNQLLHIQWHMQFATKPPLPPPQKKIYIKAWSTLVFYFCFILIK